MRPRLLAVAGPLKGQTFPLDNGQLSIGREHVNDIQIADTAISRRHAVLRQEGERFQILDLESANHTYVNDVATG